MALVSALLAPDSDVRVHDVERHDGRGRAVGITVDGVIIHVAGRTPDGPVGDMDVVMACSLLISALATLRESAVARIAEGSAVAA